MGRSERAGVLQFLQANAADETIDIAGRRARMDALANYFPVPDGTEIEPGEIGGIEGEWVRAKQARRDAVLLYLHGGGYVLGSSKSHRHIVAAMSGAGGLSAFSADYRLAPEHPFPAAVDDAVAAYKGLLDSGIAADKIAIGGDSAGGGLTLAALLALRDKSLPPPACAVAISPWADLSQGGEAYRTRAKRDPMITKAGLDGMAAAYLGKAGAKTPLASPAFADFKGLPPLLIQVGTEEALHSDAEAVKARAEAAGVEVSFESWAGMIHVWHAFHPILSEGRDAIARIGSYLKAHIA
ncbi:MAG: alpha/beta hydrolase [Proteobacteria bacterium]|nr:alpha/beta hydrolase [Pseudomonadota bacterium]